MRQIPSPRVSGEGKRPAEREREVRPRPGAYFLRLIGSSTRPDKAVDAIRAELAVEGALMHQVMQVGKSLAKSEAYLVTVESSAEQNPHQFDSGLRDLARGDHLVAARPVVRGKAVDPRVQPEKRQVMRG